MTSVFKTKLLAALAAFGLMAVPAHAGWESFQLTNGTQAADTLFHGKGETPYVPPFGKASQIEDFAKNWNMSGFKTATREIGVSLGETLNLTGTQDAYKPVNLRKNGFEALLAGNGQGVVVDPVMQAAHFLGDGQGVVVNASFSRGDGQGVVVSPAAFLSWSTLPDAFYAKSQFVSY